MSIVKRRLQDAGLLGSAAKKSHIKMGKRTQTLDRGTMSRRPASLSRLFTVKVETGVLWVLFNEAAS